MKVGIVGSRNFNDYDYLVQILSQIDATTIVSGGANGADALGERYARELNIPTIIHKPEWDLYGRAAGMIRNKLIIDDSELVVAFWDDKSPGTKNSIDRATKDMKKLLIVHYLVKKVECINFGGK